mmetsp:Transcript_24184/g.24111  ORF Transcript_24184/g.24111 Transcript_24184/m.24111 type:complete len:242 (+) Transcript_24184:18-743(+)
MFKLNTLNTAIPKILRSKKFSELSNGSDIDETRAKKLLPDNILLDEIKTKQKISRFKQKPKPKVKRSNIRFNVSKVEESIIQENLKKNSSTTDEEKMNLLELEAMLKDFEILPSKEIQDKIDLFLSPYNKSSNMQKCMNFNEPDPKSCSPSSDSRQPISNNNQLSYIYNNWKKISNFICKENGDFRKSLRILNKARYKEYEEVFKTMMCLKPEWSVFKSQICKTVNATNTKKVSNKRRKNI